MRDICAVVAISLFLFPLVAAQDEVPKPKVSSDPLTAEQIAVYRAVLEDYMKGSDGALNLANQTEPLKRASLDRVCMKGIVLEADRDSVQIVRFLNPAVLINSRIVLVDSDRQQERIKENDPQKLLKRAIDDHEEVTDKELEDSVKRAFETGLFSFSEIVFDKQHHHAVVVYSFVCGGLCGNGDTLVLTKVGQKWKVSKRCGGWIS